MHAALCDTLRRHAGLAVADLSVAQVDRADLLPTFLQSDVDVHGSHGLFYWLRARGSGSLVTSDEAGMVLAWSPDVGQLDAVVALLDATAASVPADMALVARYCAGDVAARLQERGWTGMRDPWR